MLKHKPEISSTYYREFWYNVCLWSTCPDGCTFSASADSDK
jgi:hypothetical protein